jgi:hypothetical protein
VTLDDPSTRVRRVAVGHTRDEAAVPFGMDHDDVFLTSHDDFAREVDLAEVSVLDIGPGSGMPEILEVAARELHSGRDLVVRVTTARADQTDLGALLERLSLQIMEADEGYGAVILTLGRRTEEPRAGQDDLVLRAIRSAAGTVVAPPSGPPSPPAPPESPAVAPTQARGPRPRPEPNLMPIWREAQRWTQGRRRRPVAVILLVVLAALLVLLGVWTYHAGSLLAVALPLLVMLLVVGTAITCYLTLLLARQVHQQTGRLERMVLRNRTVIQNRTTALGQRVRVLEQAQARLPFAQEYLEAVAEASAETATRLRDMNEMLHSLRDEDAGPATPAPSPLEAADHTVERSRPSQ